MMALFDEKKGGKETLPEKRQETAVAVMDINEAFPVAENLEGVDRPELSLIKIIREPAGFNIDGEAVKSFTGCVLVAQRQNVWWKEEYDGTDRMPDCFSRDTVQPDPASESPQSKACVDCPMNEWGSGGGKSKACKNTRTLLVIVDGDELPSLLRCSPTNLRPWDKFASRMAKRGRHFATVQIRFSLTEKQYDKGKFPQLVMEIERELDPTVEADAAMLRRNLEFISRYKAVVKADVATQDDVAGDVGNGDPF